jgi:hypothetical protein
MYKKSAFIHGTLQVATLSWVGWLHFNLTWIQEDKHQDLEQIKVLLGKIPLDKPEGYLPNQHSASSFVSAHDPGGMSAEDIRKIVKEELHKMNEPIDKDAHLESASLPEKAKESAKIIEDKEREIIAFEEG